MSAEQTQSKGHTPSVGSVELVRGPLVQAINDLLLIRNATGVSAEDVMCVIERTLPGKLAAALCGRSVLRHGLFTPPQFAEICEAVIRDELSSPNNRSPIRGPENMDAKIDLSFLPDMFAGAGEVRAPEFGVAEGSAARETARKLDGLLTVQINDRLGAGQWALVDLRGRLTRITDKDHTSEIWELDGKPILQTWPLKVETVTDGHAIKIVVTQPYRTFPQNNPDRTRDQKL